jgi:hypothetical protein
MVDRYTKIALAAIAAALIALVVRPVFEATTTRAADVVDVRIVGASFGDRHLHGALAVRCVSGCGR